MNDVQMSEFFLNDRFAALTGAKIISIASDTVTCMLEIQDCHFNAANSVQGGAIFTLADYAFAVASNRADLEKESGAITVAQSCNITFFKPARGKTLIATTKCLQKGHKVSVWQIDVRDELGTHVAQMLGNGYTVSPRPAPDKHS